jgi:RNA polymerase sigma-70 factor (ECF subfamily)
MPAQTPHNQNDCWNRLKAGDPDALGYLYDTYADKLFISALRMTEDRELAKDSLQEVFIEIWNYRKTLGVIEHSQSYLLKVLRSILLKKLRKESYLSHLLTTDELLSTEKNREEMIISSDTETEDKNRLERAFSILTKRQKLILELRYYHGLTYDQIAEKLGMNYQSVNNLAFRTIRRLRTSMSLLLIFIVHS